MSKKEKNDIAYVISVLFAILLGYLFFVERISTNYYLFFGLIIFGVPLIQGLVINLLSSTSTRKTSSKKSTKRKQSKKKLQKNNLQIISSNRQLPDEKILQLPLEKMSWREFERLCYLYYKAKGYKPKETINGADKGIDLLYYSPYDKNNVAVQIKHRIGTGRQVNVKEIRELNAAKRHYDCILSEFITTATFTNAALKEATAFKIETHDIEWVNNKIVKWQKEEAKKRKRIRA